MIIYYLNLFNRDYFFELIKKKKLLLYIIILNKNTKSVFVKNEINKYIYIKCNMKLNNLSKFIINECYYIIIK